MSLIALYWQQCTICVQSQIPAQKQWPAVSVSTALYRLCAESDCQLAELNYKEVWIFDFKTLHRWRCWSSMIVKRLVVCWLILSNGHHLLRTNSDTLNALNLHNRNKSKTIFFWNLNQIHPCLWTVVHGKANETFFMICRHLCHSGYNQTPFTLLGNLTPITLQGINLYSINSGHLQFQIEQLRWMCLLATTMKKVFL